MKIGIIGLGIVGNAVLQSLVNCNTVTYDLKTDNYFDHTLFNDCNAIFVCVPSPSNENGSCDTSTLTSTIARISNKQIPIICKTTAPPSVYVQLLEEYPSVVHFPEFLTAANSITDFLESQYTILGGNNHWCETTETIINHVLPMLRNIVITDIKTASLFKYLMNSYLATKVTFMNDMAQLATSLGVDWHNIQTLINLDNRIGNTHTNVPGTDGNFGWAGGCFPKDISAIIYEATQQRANLALLTAVNEINKQHRKQNEN